MPVFQVMAAPVSYRHPNIPVLASSDAPVTAPARTSKQSSNLSHTSADPWPFKSQILFILALQGVLQAPCNVSSVQVDPVLTSEEIPATANPKVLVMAAQRSVSAASMPVGYSLSVTPVISAKVLVHGLNLHCTFVLRQFLNKYTSWMCHVSVFRIFRLLFNISSIYRHLLVA